MSQRVTTPDRRDSTECCTIKAYSPDACLPTHCESESLVNGDESSAAELWLIQRHGEEDQTLLQAFVPEQERAGDNPFLGRVLYGNPEPCRIEYRRLPADTRRIEP